MIQISGIKISQLVERGKLPSDLKWSNALPPSYSIGLFKNDEKTKTLIVCIDSFGGGIAWTSYNGDINLIGLERDLDRDEWKYLQNKFPLFGEAIRELK